MDGIQLSLPAGWARGRTLGDPLDRLAGLTRDVDGAKAEIRAVLERLAERHGASSRDVDAAMAGYVDDLLSDLLYEVELELIRDVELRGVDAT
ncbi:hypothetical protein SAMN02745126_03737 [Enhydrobacter aerosaccus]|uniref:Uncharacterized protein n=2 Tax=Enhydrobacter aerosaccus TaxID=225324 RepID=A0A1T4RBZ8_9HYPH|nr:hypothetical protein SAMN02745126_03737 [Enhydrobacter aerosaccus]